MLTALHAMTFSDDPPATHRCCAEVPRLPSDLVLHRVEAGS